MRDLFYFYKQMHDYAGWKLYGTMFVMGIMSLLDGAAVLLLIPLISLTGVMSFEGGGTVVASLLAYLERLPELVGGLPGILLLYVLLVTGQQLLSRLVQIQHSGMQHGYFRHVRVRIYEALLHADWRFFMKHRNSDLLHTLTAETAKASTGAHSFLQLMSGLVFTGIQIAVAFWLAPTITLFVIVSGVLLLLFSRHFVKRSMELGGRNLTLGEEYMAGITDHMNGMKDVKSNALEQSRLTWFERVTESMKQEQVEYTKVKTKSRMYYKLASTALTALVIFAAVSLFQAQTAQLLLVIVIFARLWPRVTGLQDGLEQLGSRMPSFREVRKVTEEAEQAREWPKGTVAQPLAIDEGITLQNVSFSYESGKAALEDVSVRIPAKRTTAVVGKSGAGKSTLIDVLLGLHRPQDGEMSIDGQRVTNEMIPGLRQSVGYVPQDPFVFHGTVGDNLRLVKPDATTGEMWEALRFAAADEFVQKLPDGLDTELGDRGVRLSGGERQRLVLARAILRQTPVLILDEATSALDSDNEQKIQQALENMRGRMTVIVIAHRLSTIRHADQVLVLEGGRVIQQGGYQTLAREQNGAFHELLQKQQV